MRTELPKKGNVIFVTPRKLLQYAATTLAPVCHQLIVKLKFRPKQAGENIVTNELFGRRSIIMVGNFDQLLPVLDLLIYVSI